MTLHLRYVELRPLGADSTAIGTLSHRWFRMPAPISEVAKLIESLHLYNGDSADAAPEALGPGANVAVRLAALGVAASMALLGAFLAARR